MVCLVVVHGYNFFNAFDLLYVIPLNKRKYVHDKRAELIHVSSHDEFGFFYLCCFSTIVDSFMWQEYIARYP